jgi:hypothetical protein
MPDAEETRMADEADTVLSVDEIELIVKALEAWAGPAAGDPSGSDADEQRPGGSEAHRLAELLTTHTVTLTPAAQP